MILLLSFLVCAFLLTIIRVSYYPSSRCPPAYPHWLPLIGHVHLFINCNPTNVWTFYKKLSDYSVQEGGIMTFYLGPRKILFVSDPDDASTIASSSIDKNFTYNLVKPWLGNGLFAATGATWKAHRKLMNTAFTQQMLNGLIPVFNVYADKLVHRFDSQAPSFNPEPVLTINNLEIICKTSLGLDAEEHKDVLQEYQHSLKKIFEIMYERYLKFWLHSDITFFFSVLKKKQDKILHGLHNLSNTVLKNRQVKILQLKQQGGVSSDHFRPLLDPILEMSIEKEVLTEKEMREQLDSIIFGGHDTTALTITYILVFLGSDKIRQEKAYQEVLEVMGDSERDVEKDDLPKLTYLECIIKESLRLYPIGPSLPRIALKDVKLKNYILKAGNSCLVDVWGIHRGSLWGPDAEEFNPERWQDTSMQAKFNKVLFSFGMGKRSCIGKLYAMMSMKVTLVHILRKYKVTADVSKMIVKMAALLRPDSGHTIMIERRK